MEFVQDAIDKRDPVRGRWRPQNGARDVKGDIPDSMKLHHSVWPRSWFGRENANHVEEASVMKDDISFNEEDVEAEDGREAARRRGQYREGTKMKMFEGVEDMEEIEVEIPRMTSTQRKVELQLNELGYRMGWAGQSRAFHGRKVFLQRTRK